MQHIEPASLSTLPARIAYLKSFLNFTEDDAESLHAVKDLLTPLLPEILDSAYAKLLSFDITATSFLPRGTNYQGATASKIEDLHLTHPQIIFRKHFLQKYLLTLVSSDYDDMKTWEYLEKIAIMHTGKPGFAYRQNKPELRVEYMHMAMHLGEPPALFLRCRWLMFWECRLYYGRGDGCDYGTPGTRRCCEVQRVASIQQSDMDSKRS